MGGHEDQTQYFTGVQWLRIHLPMQGTRVPSLVGKITQAVEREPQQLSPRSGACALHQEKPPQQAAHAPQPENRPPHLEEALTQQQRPSSDKKTKFIHSFL